MEQLQTFNDTDTDKALNIGRRPEAPGGKKAKFPLRLSPRQLQVFNDKHRHLLVSGPRYSGKSLSTSHRIFRHAWETPHSRTAIFAKSVKNAKSGVWDDMTRPIFNEWKNSGLKSPHAQFDYTVKPKTDGSTKMHYFRLRNYWGNESEIQLHSLNHDNEVYDIVLGTRFSCIYFSELQLFSDSAIFDASIQQLRMPGLAYDKHLWISDTNPAEEGQKHFAYKKWYVDRVSQEIPETCKTEEEIADYRQSQADLGLIEFTIEDNIYGDKKFIAQLKNTYRNDPEAWDRFILGKWTKGKTSKGKIFWSFWKPDIHIAGDVSHPDQDMWEYLNPSESCFEIVLGWDIGSTRNQAVTFLEPFVSTDGKMGFRQIDEVVWTDVEETLEVLVIRVLEKMDMFEELVGHKIQFRHWSDHSAFQFRASGAAEYEAAFVYRISGGRIRLMSAQKAKGQGSVNRRIQMLKEILAGGRYLVSAHCEKTVEMFNEIRHGEQPEKEPVSKYDVQYKHPFDALSYAVYCELFAEARSGPEHVETGSRLIMMEY